MNKTKISPIDLIVVNFYPFQQVVTIKTQNIVENIDIRPTMVRAAKNFKMSQ